MDFYFTQCVETYLQKDKWFNFESKFLESKKIKNILLTLCKETIFQTGKYSHTEIHINGSIRLH